MALHSRSMLLVLITKAGEYCKQRLCTCALVLSEA
jgi:hypothetical protein